MAGLTKYGHCDTSWKNISDGKSQSVLTTPVSPNNLQRHTYNYKYGIFNLSRTYILADDMVKSKFL